MLHDIKPQFYNTLNFFLLFPAHPTRVLFPRDQNLSNESTQSASIPQFVPQVEAVFCVKLKRHAHKFKT